MERLYFNSIMKEEGEYKDGGGRGPTTEMLCQQDCYPEVPHSLGKQSSLPIFSRVASGPWQVELLLHFVATFPLQRAAAHSPFAFRPLLLTLLHPFNLTKLFPSAKSDPLRGFCHHTVSARSISHT